jgi:tetratricopeptide (TPR) repeat protein
MKTKRAGARVALAGFFVGVFFLCGPAPMPAQQSAYAPPFRVGAIPQEGIYLVFPFENAGASPRLDWIGEGLEELTIQRLSAAGQQVYSHSGRLDEMDRYGLPATAKLSRATMLHIAQEMDADYIVFGNFSSDGKILTFNARILRVNPVALMPAVHESGPLESLLDMQAKATWLLLIAIDRNYPFSLVEFNKLQRPLNLAAFEQYIRGLLANDDEVRLRDLKEAARLEPEWPEPAFALGELYFARNDCNSALTWFARVPLTSPSSPESIFSSGVCRLRLGQPDKAEEVFTSLQEGLRHSMVSGADLPEILNNRAVAQVRQGKMAEAQTALGRARDIDPDEDDYPFNLGLASLAGNDPTTAVAHFQEATRREPDNPEDMAFLIYSLEKSGQKAEATEERESANEEYGPNALPVLKLDAKPESLAKFQRIKRELDTTLLRLQLEGPGAQYAVASVSGAGGVTGTDSAITHVRRGRQELGAGRLDPAEKEFRAALTLDANDAAAHRELAEIYRRRGKLDDAAKELQLSLAVRDSAAARVTLARIYLEQKKTGLAREQVEKAVKLAPNYAEAKELLAHLDKSIPAGGVK